MVKAAAEQRVRIAISVVALSIGNPSVVIRVRVFRTAERVGSGEMQDWARRIW